MGRLAFVLATVCCCVLVSTSGAAAAQRAHGAALPVPGDFFGVMVDGPMLDLGFDWRPEARLMRSTGIRGARMALNWFQVAPRPDVRDWSRYDRQIAYLANERIRVMPVLIKAPGWAANGTPFINGAPEPRLFGRFVREAVQRYGHGGAFWREHPEVPYVPVRDWQVWNEPDMLPFFNAYPWPRRFVPVLRAGAKAIRATDPRARVVAPGLTNRPWEGLWQLYHHGARGLFDVVAIHPFRQTPRLVMAVVRRTRALMRRRGDGDLPLILSEISYSSGRGYVKVTRGVESNEAGQARRLGRLLRLVARNRVRFRIDHAYWYTWMSGPPGPIYTWYYSGVRRVTRGGRRITKPALGALRSVIRETTGGGLR